MPFKWESYLHAGMTVRSSEGERLGKVTRVTADHLVIQKGLVFPQAYRTTYANVVQIRGNVIFLRQTRADFRIEQDHPAKATD